MGIARQSLATIDPSTVEIPEWVPGVMVPLGVAMVILFVLWIVLAVVRALHRRAYNLTKAETARTRVDGPSFVKVDHEARKAALDRGDAYVRPADRAAAEDRAAADPGRASVWGFVCRMGVVVVALAHFGVVVVSVADATHNAEKVMQDISAADRFMAIVSKYWLGLALGVVVLAAEIIRFVQARRKKA